MARFALGVMAGVIITTLVGAAVGSHAQSDEDGVWQALADCESSGRWDLNTGNTYYGGLQEDLVFWRRHGGLAYAARPDLASREAQIAVAQRGLGVQGWLAWPSCSRQLGLI